MPELPEVETIRRDLCKKIIGKKITVVEIREKKIAKPDSRTLIKTLLGNKFTAIERIGKLLIFHLKRKNFFLLAHLKLTGQLVYCPLATPQKFTPLNSCEANLTRFTRTIIYFNDQSRLYFNDLRKFGWLKIADKTEKEKIIKESFGPDAISKDFNYPYFKNRLVSRKKSRIKAVLLDQRITAGIGNIYADESLFAAGLKPSRKAGSLKDAEIKKLFAAVKKILKKAIKRRGTSISDYVDGQGQPGNFSEYLKVYQREGKKCLRCKKGIIKKIYDSGRGTRFCDYCQK
ncbi:MAG: bifunctional DNA-formamidopyrimidine glycosylase/DNA-(apurinic or apyrimidinic site) lyase [Candidatus Niyogibacteria bacterium]|nr:bifunctional DNA-formamidopyrimidine glycosylase/DNA-(apurinic or apyrimidinic site) lyase [Candidatus Niyogibacteria bacterium]